MYWVYVLQSGRDSGLYTGVTSNLRRRIREHNAGKVKSTRNRRPLRIVYHEAFHSKNEAAARERYFKTAKGGVEKRKLAGETRTA